MQFPILQTPRLILREWTDADAENILEIFRHESMVQYTPVDPYRSPEDGMRRVEGSRIFFDKKQGITWGIFEREGGKVLGDIDFTYKDKRDFKAQLGCCFAPQAWGRGFAFEAMKEVIRYSFEDFPEFTLNRLEAGTDPGNTLRSNYSKNSDLKMKHYFTITISSGGNLSISLYMHYYERIGKRGVADFFTLTKNVDFCIQEISRVDKILSRLIRYNHSPLALWRYFCVLIK